MKFLYHCRSGSLSSTTADFTVQLRRPMGRGRFEARAQSMLPGIDSAAALFAAAKALAPDVPIDPAALDYLYARRVSTGLSRADWEAAVREATAVPLLLRSPPSGFPWPNLVERKALQDTFTRLADAANASRGTLLMSFHSAFSKIGVRLFLPRHHGGVILGVGQIRGDSRGPLFAALNALREGAMVLVAPDGGRGRQSARIEVLGTSVAIGDGAAFLAHASRCNTAWYTIVRQDDRLVPVVETGPAAQDGETLAAFSERLHSFYAKKVEAVFTGDPRNLVLVGHWARSFAAAAGQSR